ncbi:MAG: benzoate/H(+) symporter BenE family transporter [Gammaproteobacteria bacterium]|jgi:benzoate membrane transport protein|nr:benzoate/H(+) symporter BenE family transporter [Gammaproteobacteria bacterium]MBT3723448.1 benzoate/H(+) symporter BenE family transporter [Gammaproteobacteria bacterium]MBT4078282.1 benzoate/H(+) symporter BenE family transporter [Gammaproteobacteria bacterium]MBT4196241.1 benzoate/H(+) symporter BenE family transporter [Gammaproteobacteria bacterium]MBT4451952.1 benzoate/H(+) symporter BenE family transporter [Gammaproteobacteria bacterium]
MFKYLSLPHITSGFVAVLVGYTSAAAIVFQAAAAGGATPEQISSWLWALGLGMGISGISLSMYYKNPVMIAWSTPGAALLVTSLPGIPMNEAIAAFLFSSALITLCGVTGWFDHIMKLVPQALASAMLAGVLLRFGLDVFVAMESDFPLVGLMLVVYITGKHLLPRYAIPLTFMSGVIVASLMGSIQPIHLEPSFTRPVFVMPVFSITTLIGVGIPLFVVTMASQNVPGIAVLRSHGYQTPASPLIGWTGFTGMLLAPFGGFAFNLAAITAAICMGKDVDPDKSRRYLAAIWAGVFYIIAGLFGASVTVLLSAFPVELIMAIAGLALLGTIANSLNNALSDESLREASILTFAITASGMSLLSIGSAFWGLLVGLFIYGLINRKQKTKC